MAYKDMEKKKVWEDANRERRKALRKQRYEANKEKELAACKAYQDANKDKRKAYIEANKADIVAKGIIYRTTHKEKTSAYMKRYYVENTEEIKARAKISRLKNAITVRAGKKVWYENTKHRNKDIRREYNKAWRERTLETRRKKARQYYYENKETIIERHQRHYVNNKSLYIARGAKRRAAKMKRTPTWLSPLDLWLMEEIYILSELRTRLTGVEWHVDHIIPLQGKKVSGLHVSSNLQVIPAVLNLQKGRFHAH